MTMADWIAVMNEGRIEQLGPPSELYERPTTAFVAGFLGVSNLLAGTVDRAGGGPPGRRHAARGRAGAARRPHRPRSASASGRRRSALRRGRRQPPARAASSSSAYVGVSTQYIVDTPSGQISVYVQNTEPGARAASPGDSVDPDASAPNPTFVVESPEEAE